MNESHCTVSEELLPQIVYSEAWTRQKSQNSRQICLIKIPAKYDQLNIGTNNPTKFEQSPTSGFQGVASTKCDRQHMHTVAGGKT